MEQSAQINELAQALAKAQGIMEGAKKDSANPFYKSKYADLESVWSACREPLSTNGLAIVQTTENLDSASVRVETTLLHSSGQWVRGHLTMQPVKADPQGIGSCISYARRYALAAMVGIYQMDDDANAASDKNGKAAPLPEPRRASDARPPAPAATGHPPDPDVAPDDPEDAGPQLTLDSALSPKEQFGKLASAKEIGSLMGACEAAGISTGELKDYVRARWQVASRTQLRKGHLVALAEWIATYANRSPGRSPGEEG